MTSTLSKAIIIVLIVAIEISDVRAKSASVIAQDAFKSVVMIVMRGNNGRSISLGSGFLVEPGIIATNIHVIENSESGYVKPIFDNEKYEINGILATDEKNDLALLKISKSNFDIVELNNKNDISIGDEIYAVGNPSGLEGTFSKGNISSIRDINGSRILQVTAPISSGSSGGPILNIDGKVIGVTVATIKGGQNLNFAIPVSYLKKLLKKPRDLKPFPSGKTISASTFQYAELKGGDSYETVKEYIFKSKDTILHFDHNSITARFSRNDDITTTYRFHEGRFCQAITHHKKRKLQTILFDISNNVVNYGTPIEMKSAKETDSLFGAGFSAVWRTDVEHVFLKINEFREFVVSSNGETEVLKIHTDLTICAPRM
jgi:hypothetical protein